MKRIRNTVELLPVSVVTVGLLCSCEIFQLSFFSTLILTTFKMFQAVSPQLCTGKRRKSAQHRNLAGYLWLHRKTSCFLHDQRSAHHRKSAGFRLHLHGAQSQTSACVQVCNSPHHPWTASDAHHSLPMTATAASVSWNLRNSNGEFKHLEVKHYSTRNGNPTKKLKSPKVSTSKFSASNSEKQCRSTALLDPQY